MPLLQFFKKLFRYKEDDTKQPRTTRRSKKSKKLKKSKLLVDSESSSSDEIIYVKTESKTSCSSDKKKGFKGILIDSSSSEDQKTKRRGKKVKSKVNTSQKETKAKDKKQKTKEKGSVTDLFNLLTSDSASSGDDEKEANKCCLRGRGKSENVNYVNPLVDSESSGEADRKNKTAGQKSNVLEDSLSLESDKNEKKSKVENAKDINLLEDSESSASDSVRKKKSWLCHKGFIGNPLKDSESSASGTSQREAKKWCKKSNSVVESPVSAAKQNTKQTKTEIVNFPNLLKDSESSESGPEQKHKKGNTENEEFDNFIKDSESSASGTGEKEAKRWCKKNDHVVPLNDPKSSASATKQKTKKSKTEIENFPDLLKDSESSESGPEQKRKKGNTENANFVNFIKDSDSSASGAKSLSKKCNFFGQLKDSESSTSKEGRKQRDNFMKKLLNDSESSNSTDRDKKPRDAKTGNDLNACDIHTLTSSTCGKNYLKTASNYRKGNSKNLNIDITLRDSESSANQIYSVADKKDKFQVVEPLSGTRSVEVSTFKKYTIENSDIGSNNLNGCKSTNDNETSKFMLTHREFKTNDTFKENNDDIMVHEFPIQFHPLNDLESTNGGTEIRPPERECGSADNVTKYSVVANDSPMMPQLLDDLNFSRKETDRKRSMSNDMIKNTNDVGNFLNPSHLLGDSESSHSSKNVDNDRINTAAQKKIYLSMDDGSPLSNDSKITNDDVTKNIRLLKDLELSATYIDRTAESRGIDFISIISRQINYSKSTLENKNKNNPGALNSVEDSAGIDKPGIQTEMNLKKMGEMNKNRDNVNNSLVPPRLLDDSKSSKNNREKVGSIEKKDEQPGGNNQFIEDWESLPGLKSPKYVAGESSYANKGNDVVNQFNLPTELLDDSKSSDSDKTVFLIDNEGRSAKADNLLKDSESSNSEQTSKETAKPSSITIDLRKNIFAVNHLLSQPQDGLAFSDTNKNDNGDTKMSIGRMHEVAGALNLLNESQLLDNSTVDRYTDRKYNIADLSKIFRNVNINENLRNGKQNNFTGGNDEYEKNNRFKPPKDPDPLSRDTDRLKTKNSSLRDEIPSDNSGIIDDNLQKNTELSLNQSKRNADKKEDTYVTKTLKDSQSLSNDKASQIREDSDTEFYSDDIYKRRYFKLSYSAAGNKPERKSEKIDDFSKNNNVIIIDNFISPSLEEHDQEGDIAVENVGTKNDKRQKNTESLINESNSTTNKNQECNDFKLLNDNGSPNNDMLDKIKEESDEKVYPSANYLPKDFISQDNACIEPETKSGKDNDELIADVVFFVPPLTSNDKDGNIIFINSNIKDVEPLKNTESLPNKSNNNSDLNCDKETKVKDDICETFILVSNRLPITFKSSQNDEADKVIETQAENVSKISNRNETIIVKKISTSGSQTNDTKGDTNIDSSNTKCANPPKNAELLLNKYNAPDEKCEFCGNYSKQDMKYLSNNEENKETGRHNSDSIVKNSAIAITKKNESPVTFVNRANNDKPLKATEPFSRNDSTSNKNGKFNVAVQPRDSRSTSSGTEGKIKEDGRKIDYLVNKYSPRNLKSSFSNERNKEMDTNAKNVDEIKSKLSDQINRNINGIIIGNKLNIPHSFDNPESSEISPNGNKMKKDSDEKDDVLNRIKNQGSDTDRKEKRKTEKRAGSEKGKEKNSLSEDSGQDQNADDAETRDKKDFATDAKD